MNGAALTRKCNNSKRSLEKTKQNVSNRNQNQKLTSCLARPKDRHAGFEVHRAQGINTTTTSAAAVIFYDHLFVWLQQTDKKSYPARNWEESRSRSQRPYLK